MFVQLQFLIFSSKEKCSDYKFNRGNTNIYATGENETIIDYWLRWKLEGGYLVNNFLTLTYRNLFFKTKLLAKEKNYTFLWFKNNQLFVTKNNSINAILIERK